LPLLDANLDRTAIDLPVAAMERRPEEMEHQVMIYGAAIILGSCSIFVIEALKYRFEPIR
jgi:hypothetical protein